VNELKLMLENAIVAWLLPEVTEEDEMLKDGCFPSIHSN
jgi:hypothetical protein